MSVLRESGGVSSVTAGGLKRCSSQEVWKNPFPVETGSIKLYLEKHYPVYSRWKAGSSVNHGVNTAVCFCASSVTHFLSVWNVITSLKLLDDWTRRWMEQICRSKQSCTRLYCLAFLGKQEWSCGSVLSTDRRRQTWFPLLSDFHTDIIRTHQHTQA